MTSPPTDPSTQSAIDLLNQTLGQWGLDSLSSDALNLLNQGLDETTIELELQGTDAYKTRFAGNQARAANGLPILTPAQYIATEEQYQQVMQQYGLPSGFYDSHDDFTNLIGGDVSPTELEDRVKIATQQYQNADPLTQQIWQDYYGLTPGTAVAAILDPTHESLQDLQNQANSVSIGATAAQNGLKVSAARANQFTQQGVTLQQAQSAYQNIAGTLQQQNAIANRFGNTQTTDDTQAQEENATLLSNGQAKSQLNQENAEETELFAGHAGADATSVGVNTNY